jgi:hypothetical protein
MFTKSTKPIIHTSYQDESTTIFHAIPFFGFCHPERYSGLKELDSRLRGNDAACHPELNNPSP